MDSSRQSSSTCVRASRVSADWRWLMTAILVTRTISLKSFMPLLPLRQLLDQSGDHTIHVTRGRNIHLVPSINQMDQKLDITLGSTNSGFRQTHDHKPFSNGKVPDVKQYLPVHIRVTDDTATSYCCTPRFELRFYQCHKLEIMLEAFYHRRQDFLKRDERKVESRKTWWLRQ